MAEHKIMTEPLPDILDEIEALIAQSKVATAEAKKAAEGARLAGEKAASEAARVADAKIAQATKEAEAKMAQLGEKLGEAFDAVGSLKLWIQGELAVIWQRVDAIDRKATKLNDGVVAAVDAFNKEITRP